MDGPALPPPREPAEPYDTQTYAGPAAPPVTFPRISDYWPDAPAAPPAERPRPRRLRPAVAVVVLLGVTVSVVFLVRLSGRDDPAPAPTAAAPSEAGVVVGPTPNPPVSIAPPQPSTAPTTRPASRPPGSPAFSAGTFVLASDVGEINVALGRPARNGVARVSTPEHGGVTPDADLDGTTLRLTAKPNDRNGDDRVDVVLDERITWTVRMEGGVRQGTFALAGGRVRDLFLDGGAERLELTLPRQQREIAIRMTGGVHRWRIGTEGEFPVEVRLRRGAGEVELNGDRDRDVDRGRTLRSRGRDGVSGGLEIEAVAGIGSLSVAPLPDRGLT